METPDKPVTIHKQLDHSPDPEVQDGLDQIKSISIEFIDHSQQRYETVGDWQLIDGVLTISISRMSDVRSTMAVALHELIESLLCTHEGITTQQVDDFDLGEGAVFPEPGNHPSAPYHRQHKYSTAVERRFVNTLGLSWEDHEKVVDAL